MTDDRSMHDDGSERAAAVLHRATLPATAPPPTDLASRVAADAAAHFAQRDRAFAWGRVRSVGVGFAAGAAAAVLTLAVLGPWGGGNVETDPSSRDSRMAVEPDDARTTLIAERRIPIDPAASAPGYRMAFGEIRWDEATDRGRIELTDVPPNDPSRGQYQLWIVDAGRDTYPVDGGVFDVAADGVVSEAFAARLDVDEAVAFAITYERPGGVVVSDGPHLLVASSPTPAPTPTTTPTTTPGTTPPTG